MFVGKSTVFIISHNTSASCRRECFASWGDGHFPKANTVWRGGGGGAQTKFLQYLKMYDFPTAIL